MSRREDPRGYEDVVNLVAFSILLGALGLGLLTEGAVHELLTDNLRVRVGAGFLVFAASQIAVLILLLFLTRDEPKGPS